MYVQDLVMYVLKSCDVHVCAISCDEKPQTKSIKQQKHA